MDFEDLVAGLPPFQRSAVGMVYLERRTPVEAALLLAVELGAVSAALTAVYRHVAARVMADA